jgi:hypothetical protein
MICSDISIVLQKGEPVDEQKEDAKKESDQEADAEKEDEQEGRTKDSS